MRSVRDKIDVYVANKLYLEHSNVDKIKPDQSCVQSNVGLGDLWAGKIALSREYVLHPIQSCKNCLRSRIISLLLRGKTCPIHAIVEVPKNISKMKMHGVRSSTDRAV